MRAVRQLEKASNGASQVFTRLGSGQRINTASDDAAGVSIAMTLKAKDRIYGQSIRNLNDALSVINIRSQAALELSSVLTRLKELATQSASGHLSDRQRGSLDDEAQALRKEFNRIAVSTQFNGLNVLDERADRIVLQSGTTAPSTLLSLTEGNLGVGGRNNGTFQSALTLAGGAGGNAAIVRDLNTDGIPDLITVENGANAVHVQLGNGDGTFRARISTPVLADPRSIAMGDFNQDGQLDFAITGFTADAVGVYLGNGDGSFAAGYSYGIGDEPYGIASADLNGDGRLDLITTSIQDAGFSFALGNGDGTFSSRTFLSDGLTHPRGLVVADFNGDSRVDVAYNSTSLGKIAVRLGNGNGTFQSVSTYSGIGFPITLAAGDYDGDGHDDLFFGSFVASEIGVLRNSGNGTFGSVITVAVAGTPGTLAVADLNGDGRDDIVPAGVAQPIYFSNGDGTFAAGASFTSAASAVVADLDLDGISDILMTGGASTRVHLGQGTRTSQLNELSLRSRSGSYSALIVLDRIQSDLQQLIGKIGADEARVSSAVNAIRSQREATVAALSRILDTDVAADTAELTKVTIQQQIGSAILAQANVQPNLALRLLAP
jgi:flagellin-like hook-associated protein FlgL